MKHDDNTTVYARTSRLILRSWKPEDLPLFAAINRDREVMKYFPAPLSDEETAAFCYRIVNEFGQKGYGLYAVELGESGEFIGYVGLHGIGFESDFTPGVEIGWRLAAAHHNRGYATEAARCVLELARKQGLSRLYSFTARQNKPSERVVQKIGMTKVGEFNHPWLAEDSPLRLHVLYRIDLDGICRF